VVATDVGGNGELVQEGVTGVLVPAESPENTAAAIAALWRDPAARQRMAAAGRARAEREFSLEGMVRRYEALYTEVAAGAATRADS
jgi:glycosyltransferase involved in cell wall biosynthesis